LPSQGNGFDRFIKILKTKITELKLKAFETNTPEDRQYAKSMEQVFKDLSKWLDAVQPERKRLAMLKSKTQKLVMGNEILKALWLKMGSKNVSARSEAKEDDLALQAFATLSAQVIKSRNDSAPHQARNVVADAKPAHKIQFDNNYGKGASEPIVTIIEFADFQCPFCSRVQSPLKKIIETYGDKVRIVFKHNPLPFHKDAKLAAKAALAAGEQGKFWTMHDVLFANQGQLKAADIEKYARLLGLNMTQFKADMADTRLDGIIATDQAYAAKLGARGTPHFFVNGKRLPGALPFMRFKTAIDAELEAVGALVKAGQTLAGTYQERFKQNYTPPAPRKPRKPADSKKIHDVQPSNSHAKGGTDPSVKIIMFAEFQCPFCARVLPTIKKITDSYGPQVQIVFKHNPLAFHKDALLASEAALAAGAQGKFWEMHDVMFANQRKLKRPDLERYAALLGLNLNQFNADLDSHKFKPQVLEDKAQAAKFGARGTPNFFINGRQLRGAQPFSSFKAIIDEELRK
jgi:protein-disulfide isomerase